MKFTRQQLRKMNRDKDKYVKRFLSAIYSEEKKIAQLRDVRARFNALSPEDQKKVLEISKEMKSKEESKTIDKNGEW